MGGDPRCALIVRAGCPRILDYRNRKQPFWEIKEFLTQYLITEERISGFNQLVAQQRIGAQGYPGLGVSWEAVEAVRTSAVAAVRAYGKSVLPWVTWPTAEDEKHEEKANMASEAQELIDAWIQRFEPENAVAKPAEP